jgi:hypothetical protein
LHPWSEMKKKEKEIMKRLVIFCAAVLVSSLASFGLDAPPKGSVHFEKGFVVRENGDTLRGFLYRDEDVVLSRAVQFTSDSTLQAQPSAFFPADAMCFFFAKDSVMFELVDYSFKRDTVEVKEKRFAKRLVQGYASLYRLALPPGEQKAVADNNNTAVYVLRLNNEDNVLGETEKTNGSDYVLVKKYIGTLKYLFKDCPAIQGKLNDLRFNDDAMVSIVKKYCSCVRPDGSLLVVPHKSILQFHHEPEAGFSFFKYNTWAQIYSVGYVLETVFPDMSDKLSLLVGVKYNRLVQKGSTSINGFEIPIFLGFNFDNEKVGPFINYGANLHYFSINSGMYSLILNGLRVGLKLYGVKIMGQVEAYNIVDMVRVGQIKIYTINLGYEF